MFRACRVAVAVVAAGAGRSPAALVAGRRMGSAATSAAASASSSSSGAGGGGGGSAAGGAAASRVGIIGGGQMGGGIAHVAALTAELPVTIVDTNQATATRSMELMRKLLDKQVDRAQLTASAADAAVRRITLATDVAALRECDFVIEAVAEDVGVKTAVIRSLSGVLSDGCVVASNTSSISLTKLAAAYKRPANVVGCHFMNPVPVMRLVEIIAALQTSEETLRRTVALAERMGKTTTRSHDVPGFVANRLLMPYINEAIFALGEGIGSRDDIDTTMKLGCNMPMGPLQLADFIGLDTCLSIMRVLHSELGDSKYRPAPLLVNYVQAGYLGKKSGRGFYTYAS